METNAKKRGRKPKVRTEVETKPVKIKECINKIYNVDTKFENELPEQEQEEESIIIKLSTSMNTDDDFIKEINNDHEPDSFCMDKDLNYN